MTKILDKRKSCLTQPKLAALQFNYDCMLIELICSHNKKRQTDKQYINEYKGKLRAQQPQKREHDEIMRVRVSESTLYHIPIPCRRFTDKIIVHMLWVLISSMLFISLLCLVWIMCLYITFLHFYYYIYFCSVLHFGHLNRSLTAETKHAIQFSFGR